MSLLDRFRRSARSLALAMGLASLLVGLIGLAPHEDGDGRTCLVCKVRQEPFEAHSAEAVLGGPPLRATDAPVLGVSAPRPIVFDASSPRAPPA
ncbi:MAG TPA: hypothetical protein VEK15_04230 [Vicinamibacteria bacterium]|nr:hypothetical protein [Vicinamibacteria bacterium]